MSFQTDIDSLLGGGVSVFNLALNVAGIINNKKNVALYVIEEEHTGTGNTVFVGNFEGESSTTRLRKTNILEGSLGRLSGITSLASKIDDSGIVLSAEVIEDCKLTEHPLENGEVLADNKVKMPTEINVQITLPTQDYKDKLALLKKYKDENQMIYIETKFGSYANMQIVNMPCTMNTENINRLTFNVRFRQVLIAEQDVSVPENVNDSDTVNTGTQTGILKTLSSVVF